MLQAASRPSGVGARLEGGYRYANTPRDSASTPYAAAQVQLIAPPSHGESAAAGSNEFALNFASQTATTTRTNFAPGSTRPGRRRRAAQALSAVAWAHDFGNSPSASAIFQALPVIQLRGERRGAARDDVTGGARYSLANGWSLPGKIRRRVLVDDENLHSGSGNG